MYPIFKKELKNFFYNLEGYLVIVILFGIISLVLWFIPSELNVFENNFASLYPLFKISPILLILLMPAVSMKMISSENLENTMLLLLSKPIEIWKIIVGKYLACCFIGLISFFPTTLFIITIYFLGEPIGNYDLGSLIGSYIGLAILIATYSSIGIFCSTLSKNSVVSLILTSFLIVCFLFGFNIAFKQFDFELFNYLCITNHYESISRGVIDSRDLIYFISLNLFFLFFAVKKLCYDNFQLKKKPL